MKAFIKPSKRSAWVVMLAIALFASGFPAGQRAEAAASLSSLSTGRGPHDVAINPQTKRVYVANADSDTVTIIKETDAGIVPEATVATGTTPYALAVNLVTNLVYVVNADSDDMTVIDGATHAASTIAVGERPFAVAVNSVTNKIYVANAGSGNVIVIDGTTLHTQDVAVGDSPFALAVNETTNKVYVANIDSDNVTVIDGTTLATETIAVGLGPNAIAVHSSTNRIYVANLFGHNVTVIDGATGNTTTVASGLAPSAVAVNQATNKIYVANKRSGNVTIIDGTNNSTSTVAVGSSPAALAVYEDGNKVYAANFSSNTVTLIDGATHETTQITSGKNPVALAVDQVSAHVYVANINGNSLTVHRANRIVPENPEGGGNTTPPNGAETDSDGITTVPGGLKLDPSTAVIRVAPDANGTSVYEAILHADPLIKAFDMLADKEQGERTVTFEVTGTEPVRRVGIPAKAILDAARLDSDVFIRIKADNADYRLPVHLPPLVSLLKKLGQEQTDKAVVYVSMRTITDPDAKRIVDHLAETDITLLGDIVEFTLYVETGENSYTISDFGSTYVARSLYLAGNVDASRSTAVAIDPVSYNVSFVPSVFNTTNGITEATMHRNTNSLYAVVHAKKSFTDLQGHWSKSDVELLASKQIVKGISQTSFAPDNPVTRAEFVSLLVRALGLVEDDSYVQKFSDISAADWFAGAVGAASRASVISGFEDGSFRPKATITREQMAVMLSNALKFANKTAGAPGRLDLQAFEDHADINQWAVAAMADIVHSHIFKGVTETRLVPQGTVTRAQATVSIKRFLQTANFIN
ncbi:S-layer homology domain-containing protein [Paenibacillus agaridevorans]|uniref:S-layer homology domain-containing protein n=1 Tax=Paenibacillus agaridevorans TaxID=171404 RepID=UPI001BE40D5C|nr:S-layer homology domain-containing protein [Paenibacillus agaridevorans]